MPKPPFCSTCGQPATCYGTYEGITGYGCDVCCGHGNEDGHCVPVPKMAEHCLLNQLRSEVEVSPVRCKCGGVGVVIHDPQDKDDRKWEVICTRCSLATAWTVAKDAAIAEWELMNKSEFYAPCPRCNSKMEKRRDDNEHWQAVCQNPACQVGSKLYSSEESLDKNWNRDKLNAPPEPPKEPELLPCPSGCSGGFFFGNIYYQIENDPKSAQHVKCAKCGFRGPMGVNRKDAAERWNRCAVPVKVNS